MAQFVEERRAILLKSNPVSDFVSNEIEDGNNYLAQ